MQHEPFIVRPGKTLRLKDYEPGFMGDFRDKNDAREKLEKDIPRLAKYQELLYAQNTHAVLIILQGMDTAGKDGVIKHVLAGVNPQGCQVYSFKKPSTEELDHDYLWRCQKALPERGRIGIFNRSYYEEVLVVRVHPEILQQQQLPPTSVDKNIWRRRFKQIRNFERHLQENGTVVLKFFLHLSRAEQKRRFLERLDTPEKRWKFSVADAAERRYWKTYMQTYEEMLQETSTAWAPWHIIPADHKWFTRVAIADIIVARLKALGLAFPKLDAKQKRALQAAETALRKET